MVQLPVLRALFCLTKASYSPLVIPKVTLTSRCLLEIFLLTRGPRTRVVKSVCKPLRLIALVLRHNRERNIIKVADRGDVVFRFVAKISCTVRLKRHVPLVNVEY